MQQIKEDLILSCLLVTRIEIECSYVWPFICSHQPNQWRIGDRYLRLTTTKAAAVYNILHFFKYCSLGRWTGECLFGRSLNGHTASHTQFTGQQQRRISLKKQILTRATIRQETLIHQNN
jgi:hypothetical protein